MSLIERAVNRLTGDKGLARPPEAVEPTVPPEKRSTIEAFAERLASTTVAAGTPPSPHPASTVPIDHARHATVDRAPPQVHFGPLRHRGFVSPEGEKSRIAQEFRVIKRPLIANAIGKGIAPVRNGKRIMVTSAFPGEGKSFVAINLALSIAAERDHKVLLVDADVARPAIPRVVGFEAKVGLMDWLIDGAPDVAQLVMTSDIETLSVMPSGRRHEKATEFLSSAAMSRLLDEISARFPDRIVIFDAPPLLITTESRALAQHMGQIVVVVEYGRTSRSAVSEALSTIEGTAEVVSILLNKAQGFGTGGYGTYGGYYRYGDISYGDQPAKVA